MSKWRYGWHKSRSEQLCLCQYQQFWKRYVNGDRERELIEQERSSTERASHRSPTYSQRATAASALAGMSSTTSAPLLPPSPSISLSPAASLTAPAPGSAPQLAAADLLSHAALRTHGWSFRRRSDPYPLEGSHGAFPDHFSATFAEEIPRHSSRSRSPSPLSSLCAMPT